MNTLTNIISPAALDALIQFGITVLIIILKIVVVLAIGLLHVAYATWFERKVIGHMQVRLGPMRVGWHGLLQPFADGIKLFFKEDIIPAQADKTVFYIGPIIFMAAAMVNLSFIPFASNFAVAPDVNLGLLMVFAFAGMGVYGIFISGWASNSKYAFLGGLRSSAQVISYEIAMGLSLVGVMIMSGSLNLTEIVKAQEASVFGMYVIPQIAAFLVFTIAALAETNRTPFDMPEAESELVAGYFTEYSSFRFALFFLGEYIAMIIMASMAAVCFLGGWTLPWYITSVLALSEACARYRMVSHEGLCIHILLLLDKGDGAEIQVRPGNEDRLESTHSGCTGEYRGNGSGENFDDKGSLR